MAEVAQKTIDEFDMPFELTNEQWLDALVNDREPTNAEYAASSELNGAPAGREYAQTGIDELERYANTVALNTPNALMTREYAEHARNVENARTIGQVAALICSYRDVELAD